MKYFWTMILLLMGISTQAEVFKEFRFFKLNNGLTVAILPNHRSPVVGVYVVYKVGGADDTVGHSGEAHFLEHLMFRGGTDHFPEGHIKKRVAAMGGEQNAQTSYETTMYYEIVPKHALEEVLSFEASRMQHLNITKEIIEQEKNVVLEERRMRYDGQDAVQISEEANRLLFPNHPYGLPLIGWEHEIQGYSLENILKFYRTW